jgi:hypothetical protein
VGWLLLVAGALLLGVATWSTTALLRPAPGLDRAVTAGVVAAAGAAACVLVAGAVGLLHPGVVLALEAAWAAVATALAGPPRPRRPRLRLAAAVRGEPWTAALVGLAALALAWQALVALVLPPFAYDANTYHLTTVASWLRETAIVPPDLSLCCAYYPATSELLFAWPVLLQGSDAIVDLVQLPFAALGGLAVAGIARTAGLPHPAAAAAAALYVLTPAVLAQAPTDYADVIVAGCVLAALDQLARYVRTGEAARLVVAGLATGLVLGIKGTGIVWAIVLGLTALAVVAWALHGRRLARGAAVRAAAGFVVAALVLGSYWYARNWIERGNPVYPFRAEIAGVHVFDGPFAVGDVLTRPDAGADDPWPVAVARSWAADLDFWRQGPYDYQQRAGGLGPLWAWLALPLLVPCGIVLARRRDPAVLVVVVPIVVTFLVQPYRWWARFTLPLAALGALAVVAVAWRAPWRWVRTAVRAAALALVVAGVALTAYEVDPAARAAPLPAGDLIGLIGAPAADRSLGRVFFPAYRFLENVPEDARVVVDLQAPEVRFVYPLFGPEHSREVLPASGDAPPAGAWVVTGAGRPLDTTLRGDDRWELSADVDGVRVWRPRP